MKIKEAFVDEDFLNRILAQTAEQCGSFGFKLTYSLKKIETAEEIINNLENE